MYTWILFTQLRITAEGENHRHETEKLGENVKNKVGEKKVGREI